MTTRPQFVAGIDLSLVSTGIATIGWTGHVDTRTVRSKGHLADSLEHRAIRIRDLAADITEGLDPLVCEVIVESPSHGSTGGSMWDRAGLWWAVVGILSARAVRVHTAAPATVKKWITGTGRAEKNTVGVHIGRLFPDVDIRSDDEADALAMAHILAVRHGYPVETRAGHNPAGYAAVKWADVTT